MNNSSASPVLPALSVTLVTPDKFKSIEMTLSYLMNQSMSNELEVIIICPSISDLEPDLTILSGFNNHKFIELKRYKSTGQCMAAGFLNSTSSIVAYCEEHSFPEPKWAEVIVKRHKERWAAVGWSVANYNPDSIIGWACLYIDFGRCVWPRKSQQKSYLAGHHISYKRLVLLEFENNLGLLLENEAVFMRILTKNNYGLYFESSVKSFHTNISGFNTFLMSEFHGGRQFTGLMATYENWDITRKIVFAAATPLRPVLKMCRIIKDLYQTGRLLELNFFIFPILAIGLLMNAAGEFSGYILGIGNSSFKRLDIELKRNKHKIDY